MGNNIILKRLEDFGRLYKEVIEEIVRSRLDYLLEEQPVKKQQRTVEIKGGKYDESEWECGIAVSRYTWSGDWELLINFALWKWWVIISFRREEQDQ